MLNILHIGDINGSIGRKAVEKILPSLKKKYKLDFVIANADNIAHGSGVSEVTLNELMQAGVDFFTNGDHAFSKTKNLDCYDKLPIVRPANYSKDVPGKGYDVIKVGKYNILIISLIGRVFMKMDYDCPFHKIDEILAQKTLLKNKLSAIIIDMHAEATSEKVCFKHYVDGRVSAVVGTHTHVQTADSEISEEGTAYITDVGMVGARNESLGVEKESLIQTFLDQIKYPHVIPKKGQAMFNAVMISINMKTGKAAAIKAINKNVIIN